MLKRANVHRLGGRADGLDPAPVSDGPGEPGKIAVSVGSVECDETTVSADPGGLDETPVFSDGAGGTDGTQISAGPMEPDTITLTDNVNTVEAGSPVTVTIVAEVGLHSAVNVETGDETTDGWFVGLVLEVSG